MALKQLLRSIERPFLYLFFGLWLIIYVMSRIVLELSTYDEPKGMLLGILVAISPFALYAALRTTFTQGQKWYATFGYLLMYLALGCFMVQYMIINGDLLLSAALRPSQEKELKLEDVRKVFKRKLGFDHTAVSVAPFGSQLVMEARPYAYFYLKDKTLVRGSFGTSMLGNTYSTGLEVPVQDKLQARWAHLKDWFYRHRLFVGFFAIVIAVVLIQMKYFPRKPGYKPKPWGFWKLMGLVMGILIGLALLAYAALFIYVTYFGLRNA